MGSQQKKGATAVANTNGHVATATVVSAAPPVSPISNYSVSALTPVQQQLLKKMSTMGSPNAGNAPGNNGRGASTGSSVAAAPRRVLPPPTLRTRDPAHALCPDAPPPRARGLIKTLIEKYNVESALYMLEPWERYLMNSMLLVSCALCLRTAVTLVQSMLI
jgi:hypothetical protein